MVYYAITHFFYTGDSIALDVLSILVTLLEELENEAANESEAQVGEEEGFLVQWFMSQAIPVMKTSFSKAHLYV